jgi:hypothetical protein
MNHRQSYRQKIALERTALDALGLVSERHAGISNIEFRMTYYHRGLDSVLMKRTLSFLPADHANFHIKCMQDGCTGGGFNLAPVVEGLAKSYRKSASGRLFCHGKEYTIGHAHIAYEVNILYSKRVNR